MCHRPAMDEKPREIRLRGRLVNGLYTEAMVLADEARAYFDHYGKTERAPLDALARVNFSCESLKVTTRLMHVLAWLLSERSVEMGQMTREAAESSQRRLGDVLESDPEVVASLPPQAIALIESTRDLYLRVRRLDEEAPFPTPAASPALSLLDRLERAF